MTAVPTSQHGNSSYSLTTLPSSVLLPSHLINMAPSNNNFYVSQFYFKKIGKRSFYSYPSLCVTLTSISIPNCRTQLLFDIIPYNPKSIFIFLAFLTAQICLQWICKCLYCILCLKDPFTENRIWREGVFGPLKKSF